MIKLKINDKLVEAEEGLSLIEVVDEVDMQLYGKRTIPRLCYQEGLSFSGNCRLCLVEVEKEGKSKIRTSCNYKISDGIVVSTYNEAIAGKRKEGVERLLDKAPNSEAIKGLAYNLGVENVYRDSIGNQGLEDCVSCMLCTRTCKEIVGVSAIAMDGKGLDRHPSITSKKSCGDACIGCGLCAYVCPTSAIKIEEKAGNRYIWGKEFKFAENESKAKMTRAKLDHLKAYGGKGVDSTYKIDVKSDLCKNCERCVAECPQMLFEVDDKFNKKSFKPAKWKSGLTRQDERFLCAGCNVCYDVCPESAIDVYTTKKNVRILDDE